MRLLITVTEIPDTPRAAPVPTRSYVVQALMQPGGLKSESYDHLRLSWLARHGHIFTDTGNPVP